MKKTKYIYRIAEANYGHESERFYANNDLQALRIAERKKATLWSSVALVGEVDEDGNQIIYPYETAVTL